MTKDENLEEIAEQLTSINDSLDSISDNLDNINAELSDICFTGKMLIFFKLMELKPELKEKLGPMIDEMATTMDFDMNAEE